SCAGRTHDGSFRRAPFPHCQPSTTEPQRPVLDTNCFIGPYPFRHVPHPDADTLLRVLDREGTSAAWVGHLPSAFHRDPGHGNRELFELAAGRARLRPVPAIRPDWPDWCEQLQAVAERGAAAIRVYPPQWGMGPDDGRMIELAGACAERRLPLVFTVK